MTAGVRKATELVRMDVKNVRMINTNLQMETMHAQLVQEITKLVSRQAINQQTEILSAFAKPTTLNWAA